jgi:transcriptional regulator
MYRPKHFREDRPEVLEGFIAAHPFATLIASNSTGFLANHIPMIGRRDPAGGFVLRGHIARANDLWRLISGPAPVLAIFIGAHHYITPSWYPSKRATGEVVPTWNYSVVHAHGSIRFIEERDWLEELVRVLTDRNESTRAEPWGIGDAPKRYIENMLKAIVGFEITVDRLEGKFKASQNRDAADRVGVAHGLIGEDFPSADLEELIRVDALDKTP